MRSWLLLCLVHSLAWAESRLDQLLTQQRLEYSQAVITSGFYEPRSVSRYRSRPGVHSGYDIAMPAGCRARAAWPGKVEAIIPWAQGEWGVQVRHQDGSSATYGHIVPTVECGREIQPGDPVGLIARDHLDVKMRDRQGNLFDYAGSTACSLKLPAPPSLRALSWQRRWRTFSQQTPTWLSRAQQEQLSNQGLSRAAPAATPDLGQLKAEYQRLSPTERAGLSWDASDRKACSDWKERYEKEELRLQYGLVAPNRADKIRRISDFWREVLQSGARTVALDESATGGRRTGRAGLSAQEAANGGI